jgi:MOSC domain-containing protein YiiM
VNAPFSRSLDLFEVTGTFEVAGGTTGVLVGIARHAVPKGPMQVLSQVAVTVERGIEGDCRGPVKPGGRGRRQVTLMEQGDWEAALAEIERVIPWQERRVNLLVDGLDLPQIPGARIAIGDDVVLEVTVECDPCFRMDKVAPGLFAALVPDWRAGACTRVKRGGSIAVGDAIRIELPEKDRS